MAQKGPTFQKRQKETARKVKQEEKAANRAAKREDKQTNKDNPGEDPDLAGIVLGPQPPQE